MTKDTKAKKLKTTESVDMAEEEENTPALLAAVKAQEQHLAQQHQAEEEMIDSEDDSEKGEASTEETLQGRPREGGKETNGQDQSQQQQ